MNSIDSQDAKGSKRYTNFRKYLSSLGTALSEDHSILDFGCGAGGFLLEALGNGHDAYGVEVAPDRRRQFRKAAPAQHHDRFVLYSGDILPFQSNRFSVAYSWFVFEHIPNPGLSLRELVRVTEAGGIIDLLADDVRNQWDGHACIPWPAYMPRRFTEAYLRAFGLAGRKQFINETVFYISAPIICDILKTLKCEILYSNQTVGASFFEQNEIFCDSEESAYRLGLSIKSRIDAGLNPSPAENLHVTARKCA